jgi:hypothetical protein
MSTPCYYFIGHSGNEISKQVKEQLSTFIPFKGAMNKKEGISILESSSFQKIIASDNPHVPPHTILIFHNLIEMLNPNEWTAFLDKMEKRDLQCFNLHNSKQIVFNKQYSLSKHLHLNLALNQQRDYERIKMLFKLFDAYLLFMQDIMRAGRQELLQNPTPSIDWDSLPFVTSLDTSYTPLVTNYLTQTLIFMAGSKETAKQGLTVLNSSGYKSFIQAMYPQFSKIKISVDLEGFNSFLMYVNSQANFGLD